MRTIGSYPFPDDRFYDKAHHLWCRADPETGRVVVGMDVLGLESLGDLVVISLKPVGTQIRRGESLGSLEAAKMTGEIIAPVSGVIAEHNRAVLADPHLVNRSPYEEGWLARIDSSAWSSESVLLISSTGLPEWVQSEIDRYRKQGWID